MAILIGRDQHGNSVQFQIDAQPVEAASRPTSRSAAYGQKPEGGRDHPLKLGPELRFARSGLTSFWNGLDELAGLADRDRLNCGP
jgi:hypothetical protein